MAHAELDRVWPRDGRVRLVGRLHGRAPAAGEAWELLLTLRDGDGRRLRYPAPLDGPAFDVSLPVGDLAPRDVALPAYWDAHLAPGPAATAPRLRVGRLLDDIRGKKHVMVYPGQTVAADGRTARVRPYYTVRDNLAVEVREVREDGEGVAP
ncbi:hypothetical protein [Streptomyces specialis]|uniref:hypothetical protein n=1 Tax=Streptomyces specialis TaxID=498367 RepID=UPI00073EEF4C|nr:hypothetical protein [Streptomyces specialis]